MKIHKTILFCTIIFCSHHIAGQNTYNNIIEIHTNLGYSNDFGPLGEYSTFSLPENFIMEQKSSVFVRSAGISLSKYISQWGFKLSAGQLEYGFDFSGTTVTTKNPISSSYRVTYVDISAEILHRKQISKSLKWLNSVGFHYNTDDSPRSPLINLGTENSYSSSIYSGLEYPLAGDHFFINTGLQFKFPVTRYNRQTFSKKYQPYFFGLKIGINFQF